VIEGEKALVNLYRYVPSAAIDAPSVEAAVAAALDAAPSAYDSHPSPRERFAYVAAVGGPALPDTTGTAWELFDDRERLERDLTDEVRASVANATGHVIPKEPATPETPPSSEGPTPT